MPENAIRFLRCVGFSLFLSALNGTQKPRKGSVLFVMSPWVCQPNSTFPESEADGMDFLLRKVYRVSIDAALDPRRSPLGCGLSAHPNPGTVGRERENEVPCADHTPRERAQQVRSPGAGFAGARGGGVTRRAGDTEGTCSGSRSSLLPSPTPATQGGAGTGAIRTPQVAPMETSGVPAGDAGASLRPCPAGA